MLTALVGETAGEHAEADTGKKILQAVAEMLLAVQGHLLSHSGGQPQIGGWSPGWGIATTQSDGGETISHHPRGPLLGYLTADGNYVVLTAGGIKEAARVAGCGDYPRRTQQERVSEHCDLAFGKPGAEQPAAKTGIDVFRSRGWVISLARVLGQPEEPSPLGRVGDEGPEVGYSPAVDFDPDCPAAG